MDPGLVIAGAAVGVVVGLTGMGGGALMTPVLVILFGVPPLAAVSSDLVASAAMKPVGGLVHLRRGTVNLHLVGWLCVGSVPAAFAGVLLLRGLGSGRDVQQVVTTCLGVALLVAATGLGVKAYLTLIERVRRKAGQPGPSAGGIKKVVVKPVPTLIVGVIGGLVVGMTSVGSGSLIIIALLALYPALQASQLVGTDLVQAVPLVAAASVGHLLFGDFQLDLTLGVIAGAIPGVFVGAQLSSRAPGGIVKRALMLVLFASGLKLLGVPELPLMILVTAAVLVGPVTWMLIRVRQGLPPLARMERRRRRSESPTVQEEGSRTADPVRIERP